MMILKNIINPRYRIGVWAATVGVCLYPLFGGDSPIINLSNPDSFKFFDPESMVSCLYTNKFENSWSCSKELDNDLLSYVSTDKKIFEYLEGGDKILVERVYKGSAYEYLLRHPSAEGFLTDSVK